MHGHRDLAQVLPALAAVLEGGPGGAVTVADEGMVVDQPGRRGQIRCRPRGDSPHDLRIVPGRLADEVSEVLPRHVQPRGHRLDRFAPSVQHQPSQIYTTPAALPLVVQAAEDVGAELRQVVGQRLHRLHVHAPSVSPGTGITRSRTMT
jgi:hypothetical protein